MTQFKSRKFLMFFMAFIIGTVAMFIGKIDGWVWLAIPASYGIINTTQKFSGNNINQVEKQGIDQ